MSTKTCLAKLFQGRPWNLLCRRSKIDRQEQVSEVAPEDLPGDEQICNTSNMQVRIQAHHRPPAFAFQACSRMGRMPSLQLKYIGSSYSRAR